MALLCIHYRSKEQQIPKKIRKIFKVDLPAILPESNKTRLNPKLTRPPCGRYKRFISILAGILFDGVNPSVNHKKQSALQKGMKLLPARENVTEAKLTAWVLKWFQ